MPFQDPEYVKTYNRQYYLNHKAEILQKKKDRRRAAQIFIKSCKENQPCLICKKRFPSFKLDYHHRPGTIKRYIISEMPSRNSSIAAIKLEMAKCDLTCSNCHREHTFDVSK